jgi:hypothetical protein
MKKRLEINSPEYKNLVKNLTSTNSLVNLPPLPTVSHTISIPPSPSFEPTKLPSISEVKLPPISEVKLPPISEVKLPPISEVKLPPISKTNPSKTNPSKTKLPERKSGKFLSGVKDVDLLILMELDDESLFSACQANKDAARICRDENFWRKRFLRKYGNFNKANDMTWRDLYLKAVNGYNLFRQGLSEEGYVSKLKLDEKDELVLVDIELLFVYKNTKYDRRELTVLVNNKFLFKENVPTAKNFYTETPFFEKRDSKMMNWIEKNYKNKDKHRYDKNSFTRFSFYV